MNRKGKRMTFRCDPTCCGEIILCGKSGILKPVSTPDDSLLSGLRDIHQSSKQTTNNKQKQIGAVPINPLHSLNTRSHLTDSASQTKKEILK